MSNSFNINTFIILAVIVSRCESKRGYQHNYPPYNVNRYHPTLNLNNHEPEAAADTVQPQYAYPGGDTHEGEVLNHDQSQEEPSHHEMEHDHEHGHDTGYEHGQNSGYEHGHDSGYEHGHGNGYYYYPLPRPPPPQHRPPPPTTKPPPHKSKQTSPYTYYYVGRHLWYIPLYFSIYFIAYVGLLVLKSIARHKIAFPQGLQDAASQTRETHVLRSIEDAKLKYYYMR